MKASVIFQTDKSKQLEYRFFITISIFGIITTIILFFIDLFYVRNYYSVVIESISFLLFVFVYYQAKKWGAIRWLGKLVICTLYAIINAAIIIDGGGFNIANVIIFYLIFTVSLIIANNKERPVLLGFTFINILAIMLIENLYPELWIARDPIYNPPYAYVYKFILFALGGYLIIFLKTKYEKLSNELIKINEEIRQINQQLENKVEERTEELQKLNRELDLLFYRSSHDFRRPLTTLMGLNEVARLMKIDPKGMELMELMGDTVNNMDVMLKKFYMLYEISSFQVNGQAVSLHQVLEDIKASAISEGHQFIFNINLEHYKDVDSRNKIISIILDNLVENAIHYAGEEKARISVNILEHNENMRIVFEDKGIGIDESFFNRIFEMYFRGTELSHGNGLGLYVVKSAVEKLDGRIQLQSEKNNFTRFEIKIPI